MKSILQSPFWAKFKSHSGWTTYDVADASVLVKTIFSKYKMAYVPEVSDKHWSTWLPEFTTKMRELAKVENLIFTRLEIWQEEDEQLHKMLKQQKYIKSFEFVQPEHRRLIPIAGSDEEILAQMKQKGRYNIKVAQKHGVTVEILDDPQDYQKDADLAYPLLAGTGARKNFGVRSKSYFTDVLKILYDNHAGALFIARYQGEPVVALIISFYDGVADYLYGGSSVEHKEAMAPYLAHWYVIQEAKRRNCHTYDMLGAAPPDQPNHPYAGFARFKEQFGGEYQHLLGSFDLIFKPIHYKMFCQAEKYRRRRVI